VSFLCFFIIAERAKSDIYMRKNKKPKISQIKNNKYLQRELADWQKYLETIVKKTG